MNFIFQGLYGSGCGKTTAGRSLNVGDTFSGDEMDADVLKAWLSSGIAKAGKVNPVVEVKNFEEFKEDLTNQLAEKMDVPVELLKTPIPKPGPEAVKKSSKKVKNG